MRSNHVGLLANFALNFLIINSNYALAQPPNEDPAVASRAIITLYEAMQMGSATSDPIRGLATGEAARLLSYCATLDDEGCIEHVLDAGVSPDLPMDDGHTALITAVSTESLRAAAALIAGGANPDLVTPAGSASDFALRYASPAMLKIVVANTPVRAQKLLLRAAQAGDTIAMGQALTLGADPDAASEDGASALLLAISSGVDGAVPFLLEHGAKPTAPETSSAQPMALAIMLSDLEALDQLLAAGADPNLKVDGLPLLSLAVTQGNLQATDRLLAAGADPNRVGDDGMRPAVIAFAMGQEQLALRLGGVPELEQGLDLVAPVMGGDLKTTTDILGRGGDPNQKDAQGTPIVVLAAGLGEDALLAALVKGNANLLAQGAGGASALHAGLAIDDPRKRGSMVNDLLSFAQRAGKLSELLKLTDSSGRSGMVALAARFAPIPDYFPAYRTILTRMASEMIELASKADSDGVTPLAAAVLSDNGFFTSFLSEAVFSESEPRAMENFQDLARSRQAWAALAALPSDREMPAGIEKGANRERLITLQSKLKEWGYYHGALDGSFGPGSSAALEQLLRDRSKELAGMRFSVVTSPSKTYTKLVAVAGALPAGTSFEVDALTFQVDLKSGTGCEWVVRDFPEAEPGVGEHLIGCFWGDPEGDLDRPGVVLVDFKGAGSVLKLAGDDGWDNATVLIRNE